MATKFEKEMFKIFRKYFQITRFPDLEYTGEWEKIRKKLGFTSEYKPLYVDGPKTDE